MWVVDDLPEGLDAHLLRSCWLPIRWPAPCSPPAVRRYGALAAVVDLDVLAPEDGYGLLTTRRPPTTTAEQQAAKEIVEALGRHALAVDVAGAALANQEGLVSYADFLASLADPDEDELELVTDLADALPNGHEASITRTLLASISQLGAEGHDVLRLAASLAPAPIPADLFGAVLQAADGLDQQKAGRRAGRGVVQAAALSLASKRG